MMTSLLLMVVLSAMARRIGSAGSEICEMTGAVDVPAEWYTFDYKFDYSSPGHVQFNYNITYSLRESIDNPIVILLYKQNTGANSNSTSRLSCRQRLDLNSHNDLSFLMITLNTKSFWSGCELSGPEALTCIGGRNFASANKTTFLLAAARCNSRRIQIDSYSISFQGYDGKCGGSLSSATGGPDVISKNLTIVTIICVINTTILIFVLVFLACRKWRILKKERDTQNINLN